MKKFPWFLTLVLAAACSSGPAILAPPKTGESAPPSTEKTMEDTKSVDQGARLQAESVDLGKKDEKESGKPGAEVIPPNQLDTKGRALDKLPELLARWQGEDQTPLPLRGQDLTVLVAGTRARVVLDLVFSNPTDRALAGTLMVQLPQGASVAYVGMFVAGPALTTQELLALGPRGRTSDLLEPEPRIANPWKQATEPVTWGDFHAGRVVESAQGRQVYEQVVRSRVDPALAEWTGGAHFSTRIFPLAPGSLKRVLLVYDRPLNASEGQINLELPPAGAQGPSRLSVEVEPGLLADPILRDGQSAVAAEGPGLWVTSVARSPGFYTLKGRLSHPEVRVLAGQVPGMPGTVAQVLWKPDLPFANEGKPTGRAIFLLDTSFSGKSRLYSLTGRLLRQILERDASLTEFQVVAFDVQPRPLTSGWTSNTPENRDAVLRTVESLWLEGATQFQNALEWMKKDPTTPAVDTCFLLSDGQITWGPDQVSTLEQSYRTVFRKRWIAYSFGDSPVNRALEDRLTRFGGQVVPVDREEDLPTAALAHRGGVLTLESFRVEPESVEPWVTGDPGPLAPGQVLDVGLRAPAGVERCTLILRAGGVERRLDVDLHPDSRSGALGARAWAESLAQRLLGLGTPEADRAAVALSQKFSLTNRAASFLILENEGEYKRYDLHEDEMSWSRIQRLAHTQSQGEAPGALDLSILPQEVRSLIQTLDQRGPLPVWQTSQRRPGIPTLKDLQRPLPRSQDTPQVIYNQARSLFEGSPALAYRALSTIAEVNPSDDQGLRLAAFVLMEWGFYAEAEAQFQRLRLHRPFEPQNYFWEAIAAGAQGKAAQAAAGFEVILHTSWARFGDYVTQATLPLYQEILGAAAEASGPGAQAIRQRLAELRDQDPERRPAGRLVLFWNLDDTDLDLHVKEPGGEIVYYEHMGSARGAKLFWDNTQGLGPELYEIPRIPPQGLDVRVHYYGSSSAEGKAPAAAFLLARQGPTLKFFTTALPAGKDELFSIMPLWKP